MQVDVREIGELLPFGVFESMPDEQLQSCFTEAPTHPIWKGVMQLASEAYVGFDQVTKVAGIDVQSLERAIGAQDALTALIRECASRIRDTRGAVEGSQEGE